MNETPNQNDQPQSTPASEPLNPTQEQENRVPQSRFNQVIAEKNALQERLAKLEQAEADRQRKLLEEQGNFQDIIKSLEPKAQRTEELTKTLQEYLNTELEQIPSDMRDLVPEGDITSQLKWIQNARAKGLFTKPAPPITDAGEKGDTPPPQRDEPEGTRNIRDIAKQNGYLRKRG